MTTVVSASGVRGLQCPSLRCWLALCLPLTCPASPVTSRSKVANFVHFTRVALVIALLWLLPLPTRDNSPGTKDNPPEIEDIRRLVADAAAVDGSRLAGFWSVLDADGNQIAAVARTLPEAEDVIGYRGPSEALIAVNDQLEILGVHLIQSSDTEEHVEAVRADDDFFRQFRGWTWGETDEVQVDGVTSATLTSLALANGILKRMGGDRPSLVFPESVWTWKKSNVGFQMSWVLATKAQSVDHLGWNQNHRPRDSHRPTLR